MKPHKHAEIIKAWADGAEIQWRDPKYADSGWDDIKEPSWVTCYQYRIKPEEKKPVVRWLWASKINGVWRTDSTFLTDVESVQNLKYSCLVTKLEYTRTEFPE